MERVLSFLLFRWCNWRTERFWALSLVTQLLEVTCGSSHPNTSCPCSSKLLCSRSWEPVKPDASISTPSVDPEAAALIWTWHVFPIFYFRKRILRAGTCYGTHCVPCVHLFNTHINPTEIITVKITIRNNNYIVILQVRKVRYGKVKYLVKVTQLAGRGARSQTKTLKDLVLWGILLFTHEQLIFPGDCCASWEVALPDSLPGTVCVYPCCPTVPSCFYKSFNMDNELYGHPSYYQYRLELKENSPRKLSLQKWEFVWTAE